MTWYGGSHNRKPCKKCKASKSLWDFAKQSSGTYGRSEVCKSCVAARPQRVQRKSQLPTDFRVQKTQTWTDPYDAPVEALALSRGALNAVRRAGIQTVGELVDFEYPQDIRNLGKGRRDELYAALPGLKEAWERHSSLWI